MNWKKLISHAIYVAGITFFSVMGSSFSDSLITRPEILNALMTSFIAAGSGFFIGFGVESGQNTYQTRKVIDKHIVHLDKFRCSMHRIMFLW